MCSALVFCCVWFGWLFGGFVPLENFSLIWRLHHYRWRAVNFYLCSALMATEQWGFFYVPHLLWHGASVYSSHLRRYMAEIFPLRRIMLSNQSIRGTVTLTPIAERLAVELSLHVFCDLGLARLGFEYPTSRLRGECSKLLRHGHRCNPLCLMKVKQVEDLYPFERYLL